MRCDRLDGLAKYVNSESAAVGIGTMIIFIAMILVAGIAASVLLETMNDLQGQAVKTGRETIGDISTGLKINQVSGFQSNGRITQLAILLSPIAGSADVDISMVTLSISDSNKKIFFSYNQSCFSDSMIDGLFRSVNATLLNADEFGLLVVRDSDGSCLVDSPIIDSTDIVALVVNTTKAFSGISPRVDITGSVEPESGISGKIRFFTPVSFSDHIIELQP